MLQSSGEAGSTRNGLPEAGRSWDAAAMAGPGSLTARSIAVARDVLAGRRSGLSARLAFVGPAVVASIAYIDPGNFATNIQAGAKYGYDLLWVVLSANLIAMLFQALSAKLGIVTGRNLAETCREEFPPAVAWAMWIVSEIAAMATDLAEFLGGAIGLALLFQAPLLVGMVSSVLDAPRVAFLFFLLLVIAMQSGQAPSARPHLRTRLREAAPAGGAAARPSPRGQGSSLPRWTPPGRRRSATRPGPG